MAIGTPIKIFIAAALQLMVAIMPGDMTCMVTAFSPLPITTMHELEGFRFVDRPTRSALLIGFSADDFLGSSRKSSKRNDDGEDDDNLLQITKQVLDETISVAERLSSESLVRQHHRHAAVADVQREEETRARNEDFELTRTSLTEINYQDTISYASLSKMRVKPMNLAPAKPSRSGTRPVVETPTLASPATSVQLPDLTPIFDGMGANLLSTFRNVSDRLASRQKSRPSMEASYPTLDSDDKVTFWQFSVIKTMDIAKESMASATDKIQKSIPPSFYDTAMKTSEQLEQVKEKVVAAAKESNWQSMSSQAAGFTEEAAALVSTKISSLNERFANMFKVFGSDPDAEKVDAFFSRQEGTVPQSDKSSVLAENDAIVPINSNVASDFMKVAQDIANSRIAGLQSIAKNFAAKGDEGYDLGRMLQVVSKDDVVQRIESCKSAVLGTVTRGVESISSILDKSDVNFGKLKDEWEKLLNINLRKNK